MHYHFIQYTVLLAVIIFVVMLSEKVKIAYPILLVMAGLALSFIPALDSIAIKPDLIFVVFLPPLLYEAAWNTSWKDFWKWRRLISSFAVPIVLLTAGVVAVVSNYLIPGFTLAEGFLLGGIISPPDAVSATAVLKNVKVPKRMVSILGGESLMNDAASLVIFRFALAAAATGTFVFGHAALSFVLIIVMGVLTGLAVALLFYAIHRWLPTTPNIDIVLTFITPYAMYMAAEEFNFSGVLAVVSGGLFLSLRRDSFLSFQSRLQGINVWESVAFVLNGFIFLLIGLQFPVIIKALGPQALPAAVKYSAVICALLIVARLLCTYGSMLFTLFIKKFITVADGNPQWKGPLLFGWAGMRGVVSLAAALSIPAALSTGKAFPNRNLILFITFSVIMVTLIFQGLTLPMLIRWLNLTDPDFKMPYEQQQQLVRKKLSKQVLEILNNKYADLLKNNDMVKTIKLRYEADMELLADWDKDDTSKRADDFYHDYRMVLDDLMEEQRILLKNLNKKEEVNDDIIRHQLGLLDLEQEKMRQYFSIGQD